MKRYKKSVDYAIVEV